MPAWCLEVRSCESLTQDKQEPGASLVPRGAHLQRVPLICLDFRNFNRFAWICKFGSCAALLLLSSEGQLRNVLKTYMFCMIPSF